jgi:hypothetical protein
LCQQPLELPAAPVRVQLTLSQFAIGRQDGIVTPHAMIIARSEDAVATA